MSDNDYRYYLISRLQARESFQAMDKDMNGLINMEEAHDAFNLWWFSDLLICPATISFIRTTALPMLLNRGMAELSVARQG